MKKLIIKSLVLCSVCTLMSLQVSSAATLTQPYSTSVDNSANTSYTFNALSDFQRIDQGTVPYYTDRRNKALCIDARNREYRGLFATATTTFSGSANAYDVTITLMTEEDGESTYKLLINDTIVGTYRAPYIGEDSEFDLQPYQYTWRGIEIQPGDTIGIASNAHTNGEIPEHGGTAWARGRWQALSLAPTKPQRTLQPNFQKHSDLLLAQFDVKPDVDDVYSIAALGSMLADDAFADVNYLGVIGTYGIQGGKYVSTNALMTEAFGRENLRWIDAYKHSTKAVNTVRDRVRAVLAQGGRVWVQEAGQSDFTAKWLYALLETGVSSAFLKNNIIVVQHSQWNEKHTTPEALDFVKTHTTYQAITDGNKPKQVYKRKNRRGPLTPIYVDADTRWLFSATSDKNNRKAAQRLWQLAQNIVLAENFEAKYSVIPQGGVDFSDTVAAWWIFGLGQPVVSVHAFWQRFVTDIHLDSIAAPKGRLAIVVDGNSPDPDDIGASPVMFALLQKSGLSQRLVHFSHSCDLDPFKNKGRQINAKDESRRQNVLHSLSAQSIELFGPFANLRQYYNCRSDQDAARDDLVDAINASTANDPLWIIEAGEPDLIGYALQQANPAVLANVHVVSHHPANDHSGDYFTWQEILDFGIVEHQIGDQNVALQTPIYHWNWAKSHAFEGYNFIWEMLAYAEQDGVVPFQSNKFDISDAGMIYWWITGANQGGNNFATPNDVKQLLLQPQMFKKNP